MSFLNTQLLACEQSVFCAPFLAEDFPGFLLFVVKFMIQMSKVTHQPHTDLDINTNLFRHIVKMSFPFKDFATRSLNMTEETPGVDNMEVSTYLLIVFIILSTKACE